MKNVISESYKLKLQALAGIGNNIKLLLKEDTFDTFKDGKSIYSGGKMKITKKDFLKLPSEDKDTFKPEQPYRLIG